MIHLLDIGLVFGAGMASVLSPCVLPVVPIVLTGASDDHRTRPLYVVAGLAVTFILMGVLSSFFGAVIGPKMYYVEKIAGVLIAIVGLMLVFDVNIFKRLGIFSRLRSSGKGRWGGFVLGLTLGFIWIPCVGPMLSGALAVVATEGRVLSGIGLLAVYSLGFAIPMLLAGYASQFFRTRIRAIGRYPRLINAVSGTLLVVLGIFIIVKGMIGFGSIIQ